MAELTDPERDEIRLSDLHKVVFVDVARGRVLSGLVLREDAERVIEQLTEAFVS